MKYIVLFLYISMPPSCMLFLLHHDNNRNNKQTHEIDGTWKVESLEYDGSQLVFFDNPAPLSPTFLYKVNGNRLSIVLKGMEKIHLELKTDSSKNPKEVDLLFKGVVAYRGIYAIDGDYLFVSLSKYPDRPRPNRFNSTYRRGDIFFYVFRRIGKEKVKETGKEKGRGRIPRKTGTFKDLRQGTGHRDRQGYYHASVGGPEGECSTASRIAPPSAPPKPASHTGGRGDIQGSLGRNKPPRSEQ